MSVRRREIVVRLVSRHTKKEVPGFGRHVYHMSVISMPGALHTAEHKGAQT